LKWLLHFNSWDKWTKYENLKKVFKIFIFQDHTWNNPSRNIHISISKIVKII
jgi:hypothetical protein